MQCPDFYSDIEMKSYASFQLFLQFLSVQMFDVQKGLQHLDTGFGHALSEQVLDICLEKGGQCPKYTSNIRGSMQVYYSICF